jgi:DNA-binding NtrC family response regulator
MEAAVAAAGGPLSVVESPVSLAEPPVPPEPDAGGFVVSGPEEVLDVLLIDDEPDLRASLEESIREAGHRVTVANDGAEGLGQVTSKVFDVIICDVRLPKLDGLTLMRRVRQESPSTEVILMTAFAEVADAVAALKEGAYDYLTKPFEIDELLFQLKRIAQHRSLKRELERARAELAGRRQDTTLVGRSPSMRRVVGLVEVVSQSDAPVLVTGDSGTGKELVARMLHERSSRRDAPFVAVNCGALTETLIEAELFGHERGAFTGAVKKRDGRFKAANGGTLFLDEVADIPLPVQVKLLRALEHGEVMPVGSGRTVPTSFRLITATHQDLPDKVRGGTFRHDLYYRLSTFQIDLPPLRQRREDIPPLVDWFVHQLSERGGPAASVSREALAELSDRDWHGNVRELRNAIEHALILAQGGVILPEHLPPPMPPLVPSAPVQSAAGSAVRGAPEAAADSEADQLRKLIDAWARARLRAGASAESLYDEFLALVEPPLLDAALRKHHNQCAAAARALGIHRTTLRKKLDQYGIAGEE